MAVAYPAPDADRETDATMTRRITVEQARRIALRAQGLARAKPVPRVDRRHFRRVVHSVGLVQLDSVNVLARAHYLPFFTRLGEGVDRDALDRWLNASGEMIEYWGHAASTMPAALLPWFVWRMREVRPWRRVREALEDDPLLLDRVATAVEERGPLSVTDLAKPGERTGPWWGHGPVKTALEFLFATGEITARRDQRFVRCYDSFTRVLPELRRDDAPSKEAAYRELLLRAARHHGVGTAADLADYHRLHVPTARAVLERLAVEGVLTTVTVPGWPGPAYLDPEIGIPRRVDGAALVGPFDPLVWNRDRTERLFGFRYRIEIYVPEEQRVHGYYVLPFLLDGRLVARVDLKADRGSSRLVVRSAFLEAGEDRRRVARSLAVELGRMALWLHLDDVAVEHRGDLAGELGHACR